MATNNSGPKNPWAANDNPWAEMARTNSQTKETRTPSSEAPKVNPAKAGAEQSEQSPPKAATAAAALIESDTEYSVEDLQDMSLKELQEIARDSGIDPRGLTKEDLIDAIAGEDAALTEEESDSEEIELSDEAELESEDLDGEMSLEEALELLGEDTETEDDFSDAEFEVVEVEVVEGDASFEFDDNNSNNN